nr:FAD-binding protein [uncultured Holophaga sp.]
MTNANELGTLYSSDVLILGGGIAGLHAAIRIKEKDPSLDVLIAEKATTGTAGKANKGAGVLQVVSEQDDLDAYVKYNVEASGKYLNNQDLMRKYAVTTREVVEDYARWGIETMREADGTLSRAPGLPYWCLTAVDLDLLYKMEKRARSLGVRMVNKVQTIELLKQDDRVVGAVGFNIVTGEFQIFQARATVLATGSCNWNVMHMWTSARGDGIAAAWRAGAEMRNAEYSNFYNVGLPGGNGVQVGSQYSLYNSKGQRLADLGYTKPHECDFDIGIFLGMEKEVMEGRGPIVWEETEFFNDNPLACGGFLFRWTRPTADLFHHKEMDKEEKYSVDHRWKPIVHPLFIGEFGAVKTDGNLKTNLEGLWAIGDTSRSGCGWAGAVPTPSRQRGSGLSYASVSAIWCHEDVALTTKTLPEPHIDLDQVAAFKEAFFAPLKVEKGYEVRDRIHCIKEVVAPPRFSVRKHPDRMEEALDKIHWVQEHMGEIALHNDFHLLGLWHDLKNMALCAELYFTAAMERKETRGWHVREDYPETDNQEWLKWIDLRNDNGRIAVSYERVPIEQYPNRPEGF